MLMIIKDYINQCYIFFIILYTDRHNSCDGGLAFDALYYIKNNGISTQYEYEYTGIMSKCKRTDKKPKPKPKPIANISSYNIVKPISDQSIQIALHKQPISIALEVNEDFFLYSSGIYTGKCGILLYGTYPIL
jgi:Papain family cysteine protease